MPNITRRLIAATKPGDKEIVLRDSEVKGFHVRISPGGTKTFALYYRTLAGKERRVKLGRCDELRPEKARDIARDMLEQVRQGEDPALARKSAREKGPADTFNEAYADYVKREAKGRKSNTTADAVASDVYRECAAWKKRDIDSIDAAEIRKLCETIRDGDPETGRKPAPYMANRLYSYLNTFFAWCAEPGIDKVPASPMTGLRKPWRGESSRDRTFSDAEIRALWSAGNAIGGATGAFLKLLILTGKRRGILRTMKWDEISDGWLWTPTGKRADTNKRRHPIPLPKLARRIIEGLPRKDENPHVFPGRHRGKHLEAGTDFKNKVIDESGIADFFCHACRHTVETRMAELRIAPHIRDLVMDHAPARGSGGGYDHHHYRDEVLEALETWAAHVEGIISGDGVRVLR